MNKHLQFRDIDHFLDFVKNPANDDWSPYLDIDRLDCSYGVVPADSVFVVKNVLEERKCRNIRRLGPESVCTIC